MSARKSWPDCAHRQVYSLPSVESRARVQVELGNHVVATALVNMMIWIRWPRTIDPLTAMPDLEVSADHAQDIAAYLEPLR